MRYLLAILFIINIGFTQDIDQLRASANQGDANDQVFLGFLYGQGVRQDHVEALTWYRLSAAQNNVEAQKTLGMIYYSGLGVKKNYIEAKEWFTRRL